MAGVSVSIAEETRRKHAEKPDQELTKQKQETMKMVKSWRELEVYQNAFALQQDIFRVSKSWPREEAYSLTDQIRRSSRSVGACVSESWAKRRYPAHFLSKLTDSDGELQETLHWLDTAQACEYLDPDAATAFIARAEQIGRQLGSMMNNHKAFCF